MFFRNGSFNSIPNENSVYLCITLDSILDATVESHLSKCNDLIVCVGFTFVKLS